ncbi:MAG TPA: hypothetical protein VE503_14690, partial [Ornithinibacter sp.]|nr:hypothetical protein [Ornithinibacter sp.]
MLTTAAVLLGLAVLLWPGRDHPPSDPVGWPAVRSASAWPGHLLGRRARRRRDGIDWVADFAEVVAVGLEAGLDLASAALASARSPTVVSGAPWLASRIEASLAEGGGVTPALRGSVDAPGADPADLALLVAAWELSEAVGASASAVTAAAAAAVRDRRAARERTAAVVAGPRASMWLLTALPLAGPGAGALVGVAPTSLYGSAV